MGRRFHRSHSSADVFDLLILFAILGAVIVGVWLLSRYWSTRQRRTNDSTRRLFVELCQAHGLRWGERQLLRQIASWHQLDSPSLLFLDSTRFDGAEFATAFAARSGEIAAIRTRLFAEKHG